MVTRALVADDDQLMRTLITLTLGTVGITDVVETGSGEEALRLFAERPFDLILIDWYMPGRSGLDVLRTIRVWGFEVPVIMVTAEAERGQVLQAIQAGATNYLIKPFEADTLRAKVEKYA